MKKKLLAILNDILITNSLAEITELNESLKFKDDLGFDSITMVDLVVKIEDEFGIDMFSGGRIQTIGELVIFIEN
jgi:acyl carrier protein